MANRFLYDAIIVGGGIAGASLAHSLSKRNVRTLLLERHDDVASEGSGNPTGLIYPYFTKERSPESDFSFAAFQYSRQEIEQLLEDQTSSSVPYARGAFQIPDSEEEKLTLENAIEYYSLTQEDLLFCRDDFSKQEGFFYKTALTVPPRRLTKRILESCQDFLEVETYTNYLGHFITETFQVRTDSAVYSSKYLFLCHSNGFIDTPEMSWIPLKRVRGQIVLLPTSDILKKLPHSYLFGNYLTKDIGSGAVMGASTDEVHMDESIRVEETAFFLKKARETIPVLKDHIQDLEMRSGDLNARVSFRLQTSDKRPIFGKLPDYETFTNSNKQALSEIPYLENLYVLGALGSKGLTHAMFASEIIVRDALGEENHISSDLFSAFKPDRFL